MAFIDNLKGALGLGDDSPKFGRIAGALGVASNIGGALSNIRGAKELTSILGDIADQRDQVDVIGPFKQLVREFPGLFGEIAPQLTQQTAQIGQDLTGSNVQNFLSARNAIDPQAAGIQASRADQINQLNPANLGQEELLAITRQLSPLIPAGTLDPNTGAVQGATTSPVSLYRNLISGNFNQRRQEFLQQASQFNIESTSSAQRQQERAAPFLAQALDIGFNTSASVAGADAQADLQNIQGQQRIAEILLQKGGSGLLNLGGIL